MLPSVSRIPIKENAHSIRSRYRFSLRAGLSCMYIATNTSQQPLCDPRLLAARNASLLGFTYSGAKNRLAKYILRIALYHRLSTANFYRQIRYGKKFTKRMVGDMVRVGRTS